MTKAKTANTPTEESSVIEIPQIELKKMVVTITGVTPLLTNRFSESKIDSIEDKQTKKATAQRSARDPDAEFQDALHVISDGVYGLPAIGVKKTLVAAGGRFSDNKMTHLRGTLNVLGDLLPITGSGPEMRRDWVRLKNGVASIAYRPMFREWEIKIPIVYNARLMSRDQVINLFAIAGFSVGLGAWRPETSGVFGQFEVKGVEETR